MTTATDVETIARALSIALTSKEAGGGRRVAMAGARANVWC
jgi:hypothetical protein